MNITERLGLRISRGNHVRRSPLPHDRRRATIEVTPAGRRLYASLFPRLAAINRRIMDVLDEQEALLLEDFLRRLTDRARAIHNAGGGVDARADRRHGGSGRVWSEIGESANT